MTREGSTKFVNFMTPHCRSSCDKVSPYWPYSIIALFPYKSASLHLAPPPPTEYGTQPQFHTQVLRTSSTEKILKSPPPTQLSIYSVE